MIVATARHRARRTAAVVAGALFLLTACAPNATPTGGGPDEGSVQPETPAGSPVDWLFSGEGSEALAAVPGSSWTAETGVEVAAVCSPTDAHEGWTVSAVLIAAGDVPANLDPGQAFTAVDADGLRSWQHDGEPRLRLVEREDGRIDLTYFVSVDEASDWETVDQRDVEVVFSPDRCG